MKYFIAALAVMLSASPAFADRASQDFDAIDVNGDGYITLEEIAIVQDKSMDQQNADTFKLLDANKDGTVDKAEYIEFYSKVAAAQSEKTPDLDKNFEALDTDHNGKLSADELKAFRTSTKNTTNQTVIDVMDADKDGKVSREEYDNFVKSMEELFKDFQY